MKRTILPILLWIMCGIGISLFMTRVWKDKEPTYYLMYQYDQPCAIAVYVIEEDSTIVSLVDYYDSCRSDFPIASKLETQPGWKTAYAASNAYWCIKGW